MSVSYLVVANTDVVVCFNCIIGVKSSANWCVTWPCFDYLMGTRVKNNTK